VDQHEHDVNQTSGSDVGHTAGSFSTEVLVVTRRTPQTVAQLSILAAAAASLTVVGGSGLAATPPHPTTIVGHEASTQRTHLGLAAGGAHYLVYGQVPVLTSNLTPGGGLTLTRGTLFVRHSTNGHSQTKSLAPGTRSHGNFSISGTTMTAPLAPLPSRTVAWWNLRSGRHGTLRLPKHATYLTSAPSGATYMTPKGVVRVAKVRGGSKRLARPFHHVPYSYNHITDVDGTSFSSADDKGVAIGDDHGHARYIAFAKPGKVVDLDTDGTPDQLCRSVNHHYAGCIGAVDTGDGPAASSATIAPLDGTAATTVSRKRFPEAVPNGGGIALHDSTMLWNHVHYGDFNEYGNPVSVKARHPRPIVGTKRVAAIESPVTAFGKAIYANSNPDADSNKFFAATSADHLTTLLTAPRSPASAGSFAIGGGRIADVDDALDASSSAAVAVHARDISVSNGRVMTADPSTVASGSTRSFYTNEVAVSSSAVAYVAARNPATAEVHVMTSAGDQDLGETPTDGVLALSGQRLLYENLAPNKDWQLTVRNLTDGTDTRITGRSYPNFPAAAIDGQFIAYMNNNGAVFRTDVTTGDRLQLANPPKHARDLQNLRVYESGDWVGWSYERVRQGRHPAHTDGIRNAATMAKPVRLGRELIGLSASGSLVADNRRILPHYDGGEFPGAPSVVRLRSWSGSTRVIASRRAYIAVPQLDGQTLAWIDGQGRLRAAVLPAG
jgi:hypothetical protein